MRTRARSGSGQCSAPWSQAQSRVGEIESTVRYFGIEVDV